MTHSHRSPREDLHGTVGIHLGFRCALAGYHVRMAHDLSGWVTLEGEVAGRSEHQNLQAEFAFMSGAGSADGRLITHD